MASQMLFLSICFGLPTLQRMKLDFGDGINTAEQFQVVGLHSDNLPSFARQIQA